MSDGNLPFWLFFRKHGTPTVKTKAGAKVVNERKTQYEKSKQIKLLRETISQSKFAKRKITQSVSFKREVFKAF